MALVEFVIVPKPTDKKLKAPTKAGSATPRPSLVLMAHAEALQEVMVSGKVAVKNLCPPDLEVTIIYNYFTHVVYLMDNIFNLILSLQLI